MYCPDKLNVTLTGDYFADQFQYLKLSLIPCVTSTQNKCKSATDVANFFQRAPALQFMYTDSYIDVSDYTLLVHEFRNEEKFFIVDVSQTKAETLFVRSQFVENTDEENDSRNSTTIARIAEEVTKFVAGNSFVELTLRLDSFQDYTAFTRAGWYDAIGNIGGMQGFIIMIVGMVLGNVTEIDFLTEMIKGLYLKRQPT